MEVALTGLGLYILTFVVNKISKYFGAEVDKWYIIAGLAFLTGLVYYIIQSKAPGALEEASVFLGGAFATSQAIWLVFNNLIGERVVTKQP